MPLPDRVLMGARCGAEVVGGGLGPCAGHVWRIGLMGHTARMPNVRLLLGAVDDVPGT